MRTLLAAVFCTMLVAAVGCKSDDSGHHKMKSDGSMTSEKTMASMDACTHCPGVQTATADGKCPVCGMKVTGGGNGK